MVGEVVGLREQLNWFESRPLFGKRIVVTRSRAQASRLSARSIPGREAVELPAIKIVPAADMTPLHRALDELDSFDWILFTSVNGVKLFLDELLQTGRDVRDLKGLRIGAIGPATAHALTQNRLIVEVIPEEYRAEGMARALEGRVQAGDKVLLPRARGARSVLPEVLNQWGVQVSEVHLYEARAEEPSVEQRDIVLSGDVDAVTFTSSSTVNNFVRIIGEENVGRLNDRVKIACIGPISAETAANWGFTVDVVAEEYTIPGLVEALVKMLGDH